MAKHILFPQPKGNYSVGYTSTKFTDTSRKDPYISGKDREIEVNFYYPTNDAVKLESYSVHDVVDLEFIDQTVVTEETTIQLHRTIDATVAKGHHPLIVFEHGSNSVPDEYVSIIQELASQGYIIVAPTHTYESKKNPTNNIEGCNPKKQAFDTDLCVKDTTFVLNKVLSVYQAPVAIIGHSMGAVIAQKLMHQFPLIKAGIILDSPVYGSMFDGPVFEHFSQPKAPLLHFFAEQRDKFMGLMGASEMPSQQDHFEVRLKNSGHNSFSNTAIFKEIIPLLPSEGLHNEIGSGNGIDIMTTITGVTLSFLDKYLNKNDFIDLLAPKFDSQTYSIKNAFVDLVALNLSITSSETEQYYTEALQDEITFLGDFSFEF